MPIPKEYHSLACPSRLFPTIFRWESRKKGFSLIELLVVVSILSFLMTMGYQGLQAFLMRQERTLVLSALKDALALARSEAFLRNTTITICGSHSLQKCHLQKDWSSGFIVFENPDCESIPEPKNILKAVKGIRYGSLEFNGGNSMLHIGPAGMTMSIGTFIYNPKAPFDDMTEERDGLVVNRVFRTYFLNENADKKRGLE